MFVDLDDFTQRTVEAAVAYILLRRKKVFDESGEGSGVRTALAGYNVDDVIDGYIEQNYDRFRNKFELIASKATSRIQNLYGDSFNYTSNVDSALNGYIAQLRNYLRYENPQIKTLRDYLSGQTNEIVEKSFVAPASLSRDALATIGGVSVDPQTSVPLKDGQGNYVVDGTVALGLLYTGKKAVDMLSDNFFSLYGRDPDIKFRWTHTTPPPRAMIEHQALGGKTFTVQTAPEVLANNTQPFIGPFFFPGDHYHCRCFVSVVTE